MTPLIAASMTAAGMTPQTPAAAAPRVSVIMPVRDGAAWVAGAVASVIAQDFPDFELVVVDDGSGDATPAILDALAAGDPRIRVLRQPRSGLVAALNAAIAVAQAPCLARLDADDRARPARLRRQLAFMDAHPGIGLVGSFARVIDAAGNPVGRLTPPTDPARLRRVLARTNPLVHSSVMIRTALVRRLGGYRPAFAAAEDYDLWLRLAEAADVAILAEDLVDYRRHDAGHSHRQAARQAFSVRLAQRCAMARRHGDPDPGAALKAPPDWWAADAGTAFWAPGAAIYRFLDADGAQARRELRSVAAALPGLNHVERRLAQAHLRGLMGGQPRWRQAAMALLMVALHPGRALTLGFRPGPWRR